MRDWPSLGLQEQDWFHLRFRVTVEITVLAGKTKRAKQGNRTKYTYNRQSRVRSQLAFAFSRAIPILSRNMQSSEERLASYLELR